MFGPLLTFLIRYRASLDQQNAEAVLQRLIFWTVKSVEKGDSSMVVRKLCSTLVTYFFRSRATWETPLFHLVCSFRQGDAVPVDDVKAANVTTEQLLPSLSVPQLQCLFWFSAALADEIGKMEYSGPAQAGFHVQMEHEVIDAAPLMNFGLRYEGNDAGKLKSEALHCFLTWVNYAQPMWPTKPEALQKLRSLLEPAIQCLILDSVQMDALDVFIDLLESYTSFFEQLHLDALANMIRSEFGPSLQEDLQEQGCYIPAGQFVVSYAIAVIQDIVEQPSGERAQITLPLLAAILKSPSHPGEDDELSGISIEFWNTYIEYVNDVMFSKDLDEPDPAWLPQARNVMTEVDELIWKKLHTPPGQITKGWGDSEKEAFRAFRTDAGDYLVSVYLFLNRRMLEHFVRLALQSLQEKQWRSLEAAMFCLNAIADNVLEDQTSDDLLAPLFSSSLFRDIADFNERIPTQARRTAIDMLGHYGTYIERHAEALPDAVRFLFASLETAAFANVAAKSIAALCSTCRHALTGELDGFIAQYKSFLGSPTSDPYTKEKVISAVAAIVQALTTEAAKIAPLTALLASVESDVAYAKANMTNEPEMAQLVGVSGLQCLASIGRSLQVPDDVPINLYDDDEETNTSKRNPWTAGEGQAVQQRIVDCFSVLQVLGNDGEAVEAACHVLRSGLTETAPGPFVLPPSVTVGFLQQCSVTTPQVETVLSTAGMLISQHARTGSNRIDAEVQAIYHQILNFIQNLGQPSQDPGVAQNCIDVLTRLFPAYIPIFLSSPPDQTQLIINFTLQAIEGQDQLPKRSALDFWTKLIRASGPPNQVVSVSPEIAASALNITNAFGPSFTQTLVRQIAGLGLRSELDYISEPLKALFSALPAQAKVWVEGSLWSEHFPPVQQGVGDAEKRRFLQQCVGLRGGNKTREVVKEFYVACRGLVGSYG